MSGIRLLADDLTGALDAGACFAGIDGLPVRWDSSPSSGSYAFDSESRELDADAAARLVEALTPALAEAGTAFKKVDSLLRGNTAVEIAACLAAEVFASAVIAPAFPAQGRITRCGRQLARRDNAWQELPVFIGDWLARQGVTPRYQPRGVPPCGSGVFLCDAETHEDLALLAEASANLSPPTLWCGSGGLALALASGSGTKPPLRARALLTVIGSDHPVTLAQIGQLPELAVVATPADVERARRQLSERLAVHRDAALAFRLPSMPRAECRRRIRDMLGEILVALPRPDALLVTGGETAFSLCQVLRANGLTVLGSLAPGLPVSRVAGGRWAGLPLVTKSGAFGAARTLAALTAQITGGAVA